MKLVSKETLKQVALSLHDDLLNLQFCPSTGNIGFDNYPFVELETPPYETQRISFNEDEALIESSINSVRISFKFSDAEPFPSQLLKQLVNEIKAKYQNTLLRAKPVNGFSITFLVTHEDLQYAPKEQIIHQIIKVVLSLESQVARIQDQMLFEMDIMVDHGTSSLLEINVRAMSRSSNEDKNPS